MDGSKGPAEGGAAEDGEKNKRPTTGQDGAGSSSATVPGAASSSATVPGAASSSATVPGAASSSATVPGAAYSSATGPARGAYDPTIPRPAGPARARVSYHDPKIPRPQDEYGFKVNNDNLPFQHVWLDFSDDGSRRVHPLEKLQVEQFIDRTVHEIEPVRPADVEDTPFTLIQDTNGLKKLVNKLKDVNEFAVDLEHNQYRSFQGLTCLMQISTRTEDFIIDTLKLRICIGHYLREHFKDPTKRKVMHGADRDIMWLQRDFGLYVCNLFDTGQASRVLQMERNSLEHLLHHFCGVKANKEYQNADWRSRPLSDEMIKYAREDTHYLLYIYDLMRLRLQRGSTCENDLLREVQKRSKEICLQLYEKELLTGRSFLHIYRLHDNELEANQLAVVSALHQWRDCIARQQDESTGYILPNKALIEIAKTMPTTTADLQRMVKLEFVEEILKIVRDAPGSSYLFEAIAEQLKKTQLGELDLKTILDSVEAIEVAPLDSDNRITFDPSDQYSVTPSSTANISVTSNSRDSSVSNATLTGSIWLHDKNETIPSPEIKSSWTLSGLNRQFSKEVMSNNKQERRRLALQLESEVSFGDYVGGFSDEQAQGGQSSAYYYPQYPEYSNFGGWSSHHEPEGVQTSGYHQSGSYYGYGYGYGYSYGYGYGYGYQSAMNQSSTGTSQPAAARNNEWGFQQQYFPRSGS